LPTIQASGIFDTVTTAHPPKYANPAMDRRSAVAGPAIQNFLMVAP
jgi:hypothetical protein